MTRLSLRAGFKGLVHIVVQHEGAPNYRRTLCMRTIGHSETRPYHWTEMWPTCLECVAERLYV